VSHHHDFHPLYALGPFLTGAGAAVGQYLPTLVGFGLTVLGIWLQRREHRRHERAMGRRDAPAP
jgi:hypothetical protein